MERKELPEGTALWLTPNQGSRGTKTRGRRDGKSQPQDDREWAGGGEGALRSEREEGRSFQKP